MLQNDVLDVEKLVDTSENGPLQIPQTRKIRLERRKFGAELLGLSRTARVRLKVEQIVIVVYSGMDGS